MLLDRFQRPLQDLRISVTDRCNFRCLYCMPLAEYDWLEQAEILSYEEIERLTRIFAGLGVSKIRITGGEPLVRRDLKMDIEVLEGSGAAGGLGGGTILQHYGIRRPGLPL